MVVKYRNLTLTRLIIFICCFIGCSYHCFEVCQLYFNFTTTTEVSVDRAVNSKPPHVSICFRFIDLLDLDHLKNQTHHPEFRYMKRPLTAEQYDLLWDTLTLNDIFHLTPDPKHQPLVDKCMIRSRTTWQMKRMNETECRSRFTIRKYFHREFICYKFYAWNDDDRLDFRRYSHVSEFFNLLFGLTFKEELVENCEYFTAYVHEPDTIEFFDSSQSRLFLRVYKSYGVTEKFTLTYSTVRTERLPPPYETQCYDLPVMSGQIYTNWKNITYGMTNDEKFYSCLSNRTKEVFNKSFVAPHIYDKRINYTLLSRWDLSLEGNMEKFENCTKSCQEYDLKSHTNLPCLFSYTYTKATMQPSNRTTLYLYAPQDPLIHVRHVARQETVEFLVYLCSCCGIWMGLSFFTGLLQVSQFMEELLGCQFTRDEKEKLRRIKMKGLLKSDAELKFAVVNLHKQICQLKSQLIHSNRITNMSFTSNDNHNVF